MPSSIPSRHSSGERTERHKRQSPRGDESSNATRYGQNPNSDRYQEEQRRTRHDPRTDRMRDQSQQPKQSHRHPEHRYHHSKSSNEKISDVPDHSRHSHRPSSHSSGNDIQDGNKDRDSSPEKRVRSQESGIKTYDPEFAVHRRRASMNKYVHDWQRGWDRTK